MQGSVAAVLQIAAGSASASQKPNGASVQSAVRSTRQPNASASHVTSDGPSHCVPSRSHCVRPSQASGARQIALPSASSQLPPSRVVQSVRVRTRHPKAFGAHALISGGAQYAGTLDDPAERLWAAARNLPDKQREAVMLVYGEGMSHAAAADAMGVAEATVSWHVHEAKKRLQRMMRSAGED